MVLNNMEWYDFKEPLYVVADGFVGAPGALEWNRLLIDAHRLKRYVIRAVGEGDHFDVLLPVDWLLLEKYTEYLPGPRRIVTARGTQVPGASIEFNVNPVNSEVILKLSGVIGRIHYVHGADISKAWSLSYDAPTPKTVTEKVNEFFLLLCGTSD